MSLQPFAAASSSSIKNMPQKSLIMFHGASSAYGRPNSRAAIQKALQYQPDIIELDVRESRDGVLYCYHGFEPLSFFLKWFSWKHIQKYLPVDSLQTILEVVPETTIIFLDIKQRVTPKALRHFCKNNSHRMWIASRSISYLRLLRQSLGENPQYIYNAGFIFLNRGLRQIQPLRLSAIKLFGWQVNAKNIEKLAVLEIPHTISPFFITSKRFKKLLQKYGSVWVASDDLSVSLFTSAQ